MGPSQKDAECWVVFSDGGYGQMDILYPFEHAVFCVKNIFPFPLSITRLLGNYFSNMERAGNQYKSLTMRIA